MNEQQLRAIRLAERLSHGMSDTATREQASEMLRTQHAALERKDALLRQCLKHVASNISMTSDGTEAEELYDAITKELQ